MAKQKIIACIYAGDQNDEYCSTCDGITMAVDEGTLPATECGGYEAPKEDPKPAAPAPTTKTTAKSSTAPKATAKPAVEDETPQQDTVDNKVPWKEQQPDTAKPRETNKTAPVNTFTPPQNNAVPYYTKEIKAESGITLEIKNGNGTSTWYKLAYGETRVVADNLDSEVLEQAKKDLWDTVNGEVDRQTAEIYDMLQNTK